MGEHGFFLELVIVLISARVFGLLAARLGAPSVIGELIAGIVVGPSMLGWITPAETLRLLAEIGVTLLLFEVGLETDVARLVRTRTKAAVIATAGFLLPLVSGYALAHWAFGTSHIVALLIAGTLTATSTGIMARLLSDLGRQQSPEGHIVIGAAVIDDVLGVVLLALVYQAATEGTVDWKNAAEILIFLLGFFLLAPFVAHPVAAAVHKLEELGQVPGLLPTVTVAIVLFFAWVATLFGAPAILGGLAAGLSLSRRFFMPFGVVPKVDQRFAHQVETQMRPIIHLFTPIFFVFVGLSLDLSQVQWDDAFFWVFSATFLAVAFLSKLAGPWLFKGSWSSRLIIGTAMVPRGEVGLIFAELGRSAGAFSGEIYAALVLVIGVSTLAPLFLLKWLFSLASGHSQQCPTGRTSSTSQ